MAQSKPLTSSERSELVRLRKQAAKKDEFYLAASHQLKSPLAIVLWCLQSALEAPDLTGKNREMVAKAVRQAEGMGHLVTDMLHIVRLASQKHGETRTLVPVSLEAVIQQVVSARQASGQGARIQVGPLEQVPSVLAEEAYLRQAVINLVDNAVKYSPKGGAVHVSLTRAKDGWIELSVQDEGIGIPDAELSRLFSEFFRGAEAQAVAHEGTGLGLVLVKHVVEEFGGEVAVKSKLHKGSTFTIRMPASS